MPLNRRDSVSFQSAIGRGCVSLIFTAVAGVGFSVTKVIVGSEYINSCPSKDMIPVYIVISGCLTVLLSSLRQPFSKGHNQEKESSYTLRVAFITAIFGVVVNLAWLVAGTYLVVTTFQLGTMCPAHVIMIVNDTKGGDAHLVQYHNISDTDGLAAAYNSSVYSALNATGSETQPSSAIGSEVDSTVTDTLLTNTTANDIELPKRYVETSDGLEFLHNSTCIVCDLTILRFSFAVVIIDWIFVLFGVIYFCCFIRRFISSLKNDFLINA